MKYSELLLATGFLMIVGAIVTLNLMLSDTLTATVTFLLGTMFLWSSIVVDVCESDL